MLEHFKIPTTKSLRLKRYAQANEGFVDSLMSAYNRFKNPGLKSKEGGQIIDRAFSGKNVVSDVKAILDRTINDEGWRKAHLSDKPNTVRSIFANIDGKPEKDINRLVSILKGSMFNTALDIINKAKPNTELREKVFKELSKAKDGDEMDEIYNRYEKQLQATKISSDVWLKKGGRNISAVGNGTSKWPVDGGEGFYSYPHTTSLNKESGKL